MTSTENNESERSDWWWKSRLSVSNRTQAGLTGAVLLAVVMTASIALGVTSDDKPVSAKPKAAAQTDETYLTPIGTLLQNSALPRPALSGDTGTAGVPANTAPRPTTPPAVPAADTGQISAYSGGSGTLTPAGIATLAMKAGCSASEAVVATAVAIAESGGSPAAQGDVTLMDATWDWSAGLWQIRGLRAQRGSGQLRDSIANQDPATNAGAMYAISSGCNSWSPWTTYTRGTYQSFMTIARQAVGYVTAYQRAHGGKLPTVAPRDSNAPIPSGGGANAAPGSAAVASKSAGRAATPRSSAARSTAPGAAKGTANGSAASATPAPSSPSKSATPTKGGATSTKLPSVLPTLPTTLPTTLVPTKLPSLLPTKLPILG